MDFEVTINVCDRKSERSIRLQFQHFCNPAQIHTALPVVIAICKKRLGIRLTIFVALVRSLVFWKKLTRSCHFSVIRYLNTVCYEVQSLNKDITSLQVSMRSTIKSLLTLVLQGATTISPLLKHEIEQSHWIRRGLSKKSPYCVIRLTMC